jgi:NAD(P)-dependent dehydrogenase (short-subunit alcohol dehydrogenase family)
MSEAAEERPVAIVTAAGRGIGAACAEELARRGYRLALLSPSGSAAALAGTLGGLGHTGSVLNADDLGALVEATLGAYGRIDAVVNNTGHIAGRSSRSKGVVYDPDETDHLLLGFSDADWHDALDMMVLNVVRMARIVTPHMERRGSGALVNISTFAAREPSSKFPLEPCIRMALGGFAKLYADRYARSGIRMNNLLPGFVEHRHSFDEEMRRSVPLGRPARLSEIAATAAFLVSADAGYITGQSIVVDGGVTRGV